MRTTNRFPRTFSVALTLLCIAIAAGPATADAPLPAPDGLSQDVIREAHDRISPAICLLSYTSESTNTNTGEVARRERDALGLILSSDGLVMTHGHMLLDNRKPSDIKVTIGQGDDQVEYDAVLLRKPDDINACFLKIETEEDVDFPTIEFAEKPSLALGEPIFIFGVLGETFDYSHIIQTRRVGAVLDKPRTTYAIDQPVTFGFIGGPVVNALGQAIGVVGFDLSSGEGGDLYTRSGHPLVYQADLFGKYIDKPPTEEANDAAKDDAWLGIFTQPLTDDLAEYWALPSEGGIVVSTVLPGSPAQAAGILSGDVIVDFNGVPVTATQDKDVVAFTKLVRESPMGQELPLKLYREGQLEDFTLTLTTRPKSSRDADEFEDTIFGVTVRELTRDVRIMLNLSEDVQGVIVRSIKSGGSANLANIRPGFIIMGFGKHPIRNLDDFENAVSAVAQERPAEITVFCRVGAATAFFRIQPRWEDMDN